MYSGHIERKFSQLQSETVFETAGSCDNTVGNCDILQKSSITSLTAATTSYKKRARNLTNATVLELVENVTELLPQEGQDVGGVLVAEVPQKFQYHFTDIVGRIVDRQEQHLK